MLTFHPTTVGAIILVVKTKFLTATEPIYTNVNLACTIETIPPLWLFSEDRSDHLLFVYG